MEMHSAECKNWPVYTMHTKAMDTEDLKTVVTDLQRFQSTDTWMVCFLQDIIIITFQVEGNSSCAGLQKCNINTSIMPQEVTSRHKTSFFPAAVGLMNKARTPT